MVRSKSDYNVWLLCLGAGQPGEGTDGGAGGQPGVQTVPTGMKIQYENVYCILMRLCHLGVFSFSYEDN